MGGYLGLLMLMVDLKFVILKNEWMKKLKKCQQKEE
jgi:hypothetical protein